MMSQTITNQRE